MKTDAIEELLKRKGHKVTKVRHALISLLEKVSHPISVGEILQLLAKVKLTPNKTTIYRELFFLKKEGIILEIQLGEDKKRYETAFRTHHHHVVCIKCEKVEDVILSEELHNEEKKIEKEKNFTIVNHSLEFFGFCSNCQ